MTPQPATVLEVPGPLNERPEHSAAPGAQGPKVSGRSSQRQLVIASLLAAPDRDGRRADESRRR